jgi:RNA polymerase sigma factor (sigma-70 family)
VVIESRGTVWGQLRMLLKTGCLRDLTDGQLLEQFATGRGEVTELAFASLVERHGPMVLRVCRGVLADPHAAQDAFQATFLVLVKKARELWVRDSLGPWLHQVAFRTASCARSDASRRRKHERRAAADTVTASTSGTETGIGDERAKLVHEEINRLPKRYRLPIVLCDLEGLTCDEAARHMGCPVGTVKSWRARGRKLLRSRLMRRGFTPLATVLGVNLPEVTASAAVPAELVESTIRGAMASVAERATAGAIPASIILLSEEVLRIMLRSKLRMIGMGTLLLVGSIITGVYACQDAEPKVANPPVSDSGGGHRVVGLDEARVKRLAAYAKEVELYARQAKQMQDEGDVGDAASKVNVLESLTKEWAWTLRHPDAVAPPGGGSLSTDPIINGGSGGGGGPADETAGGKAKESVAGTDTVQIENLPGGRVRIVTRDGVVIEIRRLTPHSNRPHVDHRKRTQK